MRIVVELRHPAHVHHYRQFIEQMRDRGHEVTLMAVKKDLCTELLDRFGMSYELIGEKQVGLARTVAEVANQVRRAVAVCRRVRPDVLVGRPSPSINIAGAITGIPRIIFAEDDLAVAPLAGITAYPFASVVLAPLETQLGRWERKKVAYPGYQKLAYLHPARFVPDRAVVDEVVNGERFFLLRLASLRAHHDRGIGGLTDTILRGVVDYLAARGRVLISAERPLLPEYEQYRIRIDPSLIHHFMAHADAFVGDSQSMTMESAMLGTPSVRFSDFAGRISVLEALEHQYGMTVGVPTDQPERLLTEIERILGIPKREWRARCDAMLAEKIDVTAFMVWFVENWPNSLRQARGGSDIFAPFGTLQVA